MDFTLTEEQEAVAGIAATIFGDLATSERVKEVERSDDRVDRRLWSALAGAGLPALALPESDGGSGLGMTELCLVLEQQGRHVAPVPLLWTALAAMAISRFGGRDVGAAWIAPALAGETILTCALAEPGAGEPFEPSLEAVPDPGGGWRVSGLRVSVPYAHVAGRVLTPALVAGTDQLVVVLADPSAGGVTQERAEATDRQVLSHLTFDGALVGAADVVAGPDSGRAAMAWILQRALVGISAVQLGVAEQALALAAAYTSTRLQFGKPLSSFQSTSARAADAYIDTEAMRVTLWQAAWRLDNGLDASVAVEVAKWWAAEAGQRVVHATQHLHGGMGADIEYPIHRYFLAGKQLEDTLGGGSAHLARIGAALASPR
jgi:alkylation response protein AidB-like acyl-CoA dehydrogenase